MKTQKSAVFAVLFAILAVFCFFTACEQEPEPKEEVKKPSATPGSGVYTSAQTVTLASETTGADIYYTLDGTTPTTRSAKYSSAITTSGSETTTLKAIAVKKGWSDSWVLTETYHIPENRIENGNVNVSGSWSQLLDSIETAGKYVYLDLSACTMNQTDFDSDVNIKIGKKYIVSLILPTVATSIAMAYPLVGDNFLYFDNLKSISGENITTIGGWALSGRAYLQSANFPKAETIGKYAFSTTSLQSVDFPQVTTIAERAFTDCTSLQSLNIPKVTTIGDRAFSGAGTTALVITMGSTAPKLGDAMFGTTITVTVKVPSGATGYLPFTGTTVTVSSGVDVNWANGLRGGGWNGSAFTNSVYLDRSGVTVIIQQQ